ncbi:MAG TPA: outer membrane beta-barrel protein [Xanthobacteraceae bacterium]|jgi:outer membrane immunogenic protein
MRPAKFLALPALVAVATVGASTFSVAADLGVLKAPPAAPPVFSWTGFYVGGNLGGAWAEHNLTDSLYGATWETGTGSGAFIGGGQLGFIYQYETLVVGAETEFEGIGNNKNGSGVFIPALGDTIAINSHHRSITALAARLGVAHDNFLFYAKGGGGWLGNNDLTVVDLTTGASMSLANSKTVFLAGAGLEWAPVNNWTVKAEFELFTLSNKTVVIPLTAPLLAGDTFTGNRNILVAKVGFNYLFRWGPGAVYRQ